MILPLPWTAKEAAATVGPEWSALRAPKGHERGPAWLAWRIGVDEALAAGLLERRTITFGTPMDGGGWCEWRRAA